MPAFSARKPAAWIDGPSAIGSVKGIPISIMSAPAFGSALRMSSDVFGSGSPAIRKVTNAERPWLASSANLASIRVVMVQSSRRGVSSRYLRSRRHPHPNPPPQAGEGAELARSIVCSTQRDREDDEAQASFAPRRRSVPSPACGGGLGWGLPPRTRCERSSRLLPALQNFRDLRNVLVAAAGKIDDHQVIARTFWRELHHLGDGVRRLQCRRNAFKPRQQLKRRERFLVGRGEIVDPAGFVQAGMLRADAGIVQSCR